MNDPSALTVFTHDYPPDTSEALGRLIEVATGAGVEVRVPSDEAEKHALAEQPGVVLGASPDADTDLAIALGGDGTMLRAMRTFAGRGVPVFTFNFGHIGFLATVERTELEAGLHRALAGEFEITRMPALAVDGGAGTSLGVNDISVHRRPSNRVAHLAYAVEGEEVGRVRCDGLVAATPVGSTGYNLANGGPVLAWGVEGFVVSFIAPHTLGARALVVAPGDVLTVDNLSEREEVDVTTDGQMVHGLGPKRSIEVRFLDAQVLLAQLPGSTFYRRFSEKFGELSR